MSARTVPFLDLRRGGPELDAELEEAFRRVLRGGQYILGPEVLAFERACAEALGVPYAVGVSSGSDALLAALMALGVGPGDEVLCPSFTFFATAGAIARTGARPVFFDVRPEDFLADVDDAAARVTARTRAIVPVHLFGQCADVAALAERLPGVPIVEDAAQAFGARREGHGAGALGTFGCFSFFPSKNLGGLGDGGLVTARAEADADRVRLLRTHGARPKYHHAVVGGNFRLDALQAALLGVKLRRVETWTGARQRHAALYGELFGASGIAAPSAREDPADARLLFPKATTERHVWNQYCVRVPHGRRDAVREALGARGIGTEIYYPVPMHRQACFAALGQAEGDLPVSERASREALALPIFPELTELEIESVASSLIDVLRAH